MATPITHWKSLYETDREFYELCYQQTADFYGNRYPDPEDAPAQIYVAFGYLDALLTLDQVDDEAIRLFGSGCCSFFAIALQELTGLPFAVFTSPEAQDDGWERWTGHAAVALPDGNFLDIYGAVSADEISSRYRFSEPVAPTILGWDGYLELQFGSKDVSDPFRSFDPLQLRIIRHFAGLVASNAGVSVKQN